MLVNPAEMCEMLGEEKKGSYRCQLQVKRPLASVFMSDQNYSRIPTSPLPHMPLQFCGTTPLRYASKR